MLLGAEQDCGSKIVMELAVYASGRDPGMEKRSARAFSSITKGPTRLPPIDAPYLNDGAV